MLGPRAVRHREDAHGGGDDDGGGGDPGAGGGGLLLRLVLLLGVDPWGDGAEGLGGGGDHQYGLHGQGISWIGTSSEWPPVSKCAHMRLLKRHIMYCCPLPAEEGRCHQGTYKVRL